jgi:hypothetical protein
MAARTSAGSTDGGIRWYSVRRARANGPSLGDQRLAPAITALTTLHTVVPGSVTFKDKLYAAYIDNADKFTTAGDKKQAATQLDEAVQLDNGRDEAKDRQVALCPNASIKTSELSNGRRGTGTVDVEHAEVLPGRRTKVLKGKHSCRNVRGYCRCVSPQEWQWAGRATRAR